MAAIPVGFYNAEFIFNVDGSPRDITWGLGIDYSGDPSGDPTTVADQVYDSFTQIGCAYTAVNMQLGWFFTGVSVTFMDESGPITGQHLETVAGTSTGTTVPVNCAILATKQTASGGRRNKGRAYLPPLSPSETSIDNVGNITSPTLASAQLSYDTCFEALNDTDCSPVLFHQSAPFTPTPITGFRLSGLLATQRRRMRS